MKSNLMIINSIVRIVIILVIFSSFYPVLATETTVSSFVYVDDSKDLNIFYRMSSSPEIISSGPFTINHNNSTYQLASSFAGRITIANTVTNVKIIGSGTQNSHSDIVFQNGRTEPIALTIEDLNLFGVAAHGIDFANVGDFENKLYISGDNIVIGYWQGAGLHVPVGVNLVIDKADGAGAASLSVKGGGGAAAIGGYHSSAGSITIAGGKIKAEGGGYSAGGAGIGGGAGGSGGTITITGGEVEATGYLWNNDYEDGNGAGIGGGAGGAGGIITIEGGRVKAKGWNGGAGIGGGREGASGTITINGGEVEAIGGNYVSGATHGGGAGIGGGAGASGGNITIEGGTVTATGGTGLYTSSYTGGAGAGIGGGGGSHRNSNILGGSGGTITIKGGSVIAEGGPVLNYTNQWNNYLDSTSGLGGAGIGGGGGSDFTLGGSGGSIVILDGTVRGIGVSGGAGIGGGKQNDGGNIIIEGGIVIVSGSHSAAGIGGGGNRLGPGGSGGNITIRGGEVEAVGGPAGAGIGGGSSLWGPVTGGNITIEGGLVKAQGGNGSAGIGGGHIGSGGTITIINNPIVIATGIQGAADIGNGVDGTGPTILQDGSDNELSYIRMGVTHRSSGKPKVVLSANGMDYITNDSGLTGFFIMKNTSPSLGIKALDINVETNINIAASQAQSRRETIELAYHRADLSQLVLNGGTLDPEFNSKETEYFASVAYGISSITVTPTAAETGARIKGNDTDITSGTSSQIIPLEVGDNEIEIVVTAEDGNTQKTYALLITRREQKVLTVGGSFTVYEKEHDGTTNALINENNLLLLGIVGSDQVALHPMVAFDDPNVGYRTVRLTEASSISGAQAGNYRLVLEDGPTCVGRINPKELTVVDAVVEEKFYNGTTGAIISGATLFGVMEGDQVILENHTSGTFTQVAVGTNIGVTTNMTISGADSSKYTLIQPELNGIILAKELAVIEAIVQEKFYDGTISATLIGATLSGVVEGDQVILENHTSGTFAQAGFGTDIEVTTNMSISGMDSSNYILIQPKGLKADIKAVALTITADNKFKTYGDKDPVLTREVTEGALLEGDEITGALTRSAGENVGDYLIEQGTLTAGSNYVITFEVGTLAIAKKDLTITANNQTKIYGTELDLGTSEFTAIGLVDFDIVTGVTLISDGAAATAIVGGSPYIIVPSAAVGTGLGNYNIEYENSELTVSPKALKITAHNQSKIYGTELDLGTSEFTSVGLVNLDTVTSVNLTSDGAAAIAIVGGSPYIIVPSAAVGTGLGNYHIEYENSELTVSPKVLTITANNQSKIYGTELDLGTSEFTAVGLVNLDTVTSVTLTSDGTVETAAVSGSPYIIVPSAAVGTGLENYNIEYEDSELTVNPKVLTITAHNQSKTYGELDPELTYQITEGALIDSDEVCGVLTREMGENVGSYQILQGDLTAGSDYIIIFVEAELTIHPKSLIITADDISKVVGANDPDFTVSYYGLVVDGDATLLEGTLVFYREEGENPGTYTITPSGLSSDNYQILFEAGILAILNNNPELNNLSLGSGILAPGFNSDITSYTANVANSIRSINITPLAEDSKATIKVNDVAIISGHTSGEVLLNVGANMISVVVTAEDGETRKTYTIIMTRENPPVDDDGGYTPPPAPGTDTITIGGVDRISRQTTITNEGRIIETFTVQTAVAQQLKEARNAGKKAVVIKVESNSEASTAVNIPANVLNSATGMKVAVATQNTTLELPATLVAVLAATGQELVLSVERGEVEAVQNELAGIPQAEGAIVLGTPTVINTTLRGQITVTLPLTGMVLPEDPQAREIYLESLAVFIIHSDGEKKIIGGDIVKDANGKPVSIRFTVDRFSTFAVVKLPKPLNQTSVIGLTIGEMVATINGNPYLLDAAPFIDRETNRTLVPVRFVSELLGAKIEWLAETQQVRILEQDTEITLTIGSDEVIVNGNVVTLDCPAEILSPGRTFVPLRFVSETMGTQVGWDEATQSITIKG